jgi:uncharacterized membrane protein YuzA (DUF378 family)
MKHYRRIRAMMLTGLFFILLTFAGLWVTPDYGLPCDEPAEQTILRENLLAYSLRLGGPDSSAAKYYTSLGVQLIAQSVERDHGEAAYYLAAPLLTLAETAPDKMTTLWHMYTWLWFMAGVFALYSLMRAMGLSRTLSCFTALMLYLSPRFFAEGHYNNKDVVLLALVLCTLAAGARFLRKPSFPRALLFSLFGALATNTKIVGALAWGLVGLATLIQLIHTHRLTLRNILIGLSAVVSFLLFYILLTPALWDDPAGYISYVFTNATAFSRWSGVVYFNGVYYNPTRGLPMPRTYLPTMIALTTPVPFLLLAAIGQIRALVLWRRQNVHRAMLAVLTAAWLLPVLYAVLFRPLMYNGWRHFYFLYAGLAALMGIGLQGLWNLTKKRRGVLRTAMTALLCALLVYQAAGIALNHPYQYAYYNVLTTDAQADYELDYWDVSTVNAMRKLCTYNARDPWLPLILGSRDTMSWFGVEHGYEVLTATEKETLTVVKDENAPYLFYNTTYAGIYSVDPPQGYRVLFTLEGYGSTLCTVYERITEQ